MNCKFEFASAPFTCPRNPEFTVRVYREESVDTPLRYLYRYIGFGIPEQLGKPIFGENHNMIVAIREYNQLKGRNIPEPVPIWTAPYPCVFELTDLINKNQDLFWNTCEQVGGSPNRLRQAFTIALSKKFPFIKIHEDRYGEVDFVCRDHDVLNAYRKYSLRIIENSLYRPDERDLFISHLYPEQQPIFHESVELSERHNEDYEAKLKADRIKLLENKLRHDGILPPE